MAVIKPSFTYVVRMESVLRYLKLPFWGLKMEVKSGLINK